MSADGPNGRSATQKAFDDLSRMLERQERNDPFRGLSDQVIVQTLTEKGWPGVRLAPGKRGGIEVPLGELVSLAYCTAEGREHLERLQGAHGNLPRGPYWHDTAGERSRIVRIFRAPPGGVGVPVAENLHGTAPGLTLRASGVEVLWNPTRWTVPPFAGEGHPSHTPIPELPAWLAEIARDPVAAARAMSTATLSSGEKRELAGWEERLTRSRGRAVNTFGNVMKIMRHAPPFVGRLRLNQMTQGVEFEGRPLPEGRVGWMRETIEDAEWGGFSPSESSIMQATRALAEEASFHPVQEYLNGLRWDGTKRLDDIASRVLHAGDEPLTRTMVRRWFISAVARALQPGCQVDTALVLIGLQGWRKSSFFRALAPKWFGDTEIRIGDKDSYGQIHAAWITEWGELDRITSQRHAGEVKAFISRRDDLFRPPYGRTTASFKRSCVIVGSTNENEFLTDPTGSRRFWCVRVGREIDAKLVEEVRDQLWAEAVVAYRANEQWWLDNAEDVQREEAAESFRVRDAWEDLVERWVTEKWPEVRVSSGMRHLTTATILTKALDHPARDISRQAQMRVAAVMRALGFTQERPLVAPAEAKLYPNGQGHGQRRPTVWVRADLDPQPIETDQDHDEEGFDAPPP